jgi:hypothetical protein
LVMKRIRTDGNDWRYFNGKPIRVTSKLHIVELQNKGISYTIDSSNEELLKYEKSLAEAKKTAERNHPSRNDRC